MRLFRKKRRAIVELDEVLLDATNIPSFNQARLEGKRELPISIRSIYGVGAVFVGIILLFVLKIFDLQVTQGAEFKSIAENNSVNQAVIIAERGVVYDRRGELVAWNEFDGRSVYDFPIRAYTDRLGLGQGFKV